MRIPCFVEIRVGEWKGTLGGSVLVEGSLIEVEIGERLGAVAIRFEIELLFGRTPGRGDGRGIRVLADRDQEGTYDFRGRQKREERKRLLAPGVEGVDEVISVFKDHLIYSCARRRDTTG